MYVHFYVEYRKCIVCYVKNEELIATPSGYATPFVKSVKVQSQRHNFSP